ncbi:hypothetical protein EDD18DRAFT_1191928 [Armillaria luteobubalina]|uniref:Uncharacterized protein n=1 Tax=Armillaria luteobubalina TaxID=153913 RepID=A0AA39PPC7_9AGAR|nr:hypothetical protein EDD18DRAFT_1191928 [Armillaria luteobubalina]
MGPQSYTLFRANYLFIYPFETPLRRYEVTSEEDVLVIATFMRRCLRLDSDKPSAEQLLDDALCVEKSV